MGKIAARSSLSVTGKRNAAISDGVGAIRCAIVSNALFPFVAAERGYIDDVIMPRACASPARWRRSGNKHVEMPGRKHDNLPV